MNRVRDVRLTPQLESRLSDAMRLITLNAGEPIAIVLAPMERLVNKGAQVETFWGVPLRTHDDARRGRIVVRSRSAHQEISV